MGLFRRAARLGSAAAMVDAGLMCWEEGQRREAVEYYQSAAELGHPAGCATWGSPTSKVLWIWLPRKSAISWSRS
jgi:TPR repeat protein